MKTVLINILLILLLFGCAQTGSKISETPDSVHSQAQAADDPQQAMLEQALNLRETHPQLFGEANGVLVIDIVPDSQGEKAGLKSGDILLIYDNTPLNSNEHLIELTGSKNESASVKLTYLRNQELQEVGIHGGRIGVMIMSLIPDEPELVFDRLAAFPFQNLTGDQTLDWVSIAFQESLNIDLWYLPVGWVEPLPSFVPNIKEKCLDLAITCVASLDRKAWQEIAKNKNYQYGIWGKYSQQEDGLKIEIFLIDIENKQIVDSKEAIVSLEQLTNQTGELLLELINSINTDVTEEQIQRVKFPETSNISALKNNALGFWTQQQHLVADDDRTKQRLEEIWKAYLLKATKADPSYANARNNLGRNYLIVNNQKRAKQAFKYTLEINPNHPDALEGLVKIYVSRNDIDSASIILEKLIYVSPSHSLFDRYVLAVIYFTNNKFAEAKPLLEYALPILINHYGLEREDVAHSFFMLGYIAMNLGELSQAATYFEQALLIQEKIYETNNSEMVTSLNMLGAINLSQGNFAQSQEFFDRALKIQIEIEGYENLDVAQRYFNLGIANQGLGNFDEAKENFEHSLAIYEKLLGTEHELVARSLSKIALLDYTTGEPLQAIEYYDRALSINKRLYGQESSEVSKNLNDLAGVYKYLDDFDQAEKLHRQSLSITEKIYGPDSKKIINSLQGLARLYLAVDDYAQAKPLLERSLAILEEDKDSGYEDLYSKLFEHFGPLDSVLILVDLADLYMSLGDYEKARQLLDPLLPETYRIFGDSHFFTGYALVKTANLYMHLGGYAQAKSLLDDARVYLTNTFGPDDSTVATIIDYLGHVHFYLQEYNEAKTYFKHSLEISEKTRGLDHSSVATSLTGLAAAHTELGEYSQAEQYLKRALLIKQNLQRPLEFVTVLGNFRELYAKQQQPEEAILFGKLAINTLQAHRGRLKTLEEGLQKSFLDKRSFHYQNLAEILIEQGRLAEAEQVMAMLKEEEYFDFIRRDGKDDMRTTQAGYTPVESGIVRQIDQFSDQLVSLGKEYEHLEELKKLNQIDEQAKTRLTEVENKLEKAQDGFLNLLSSLEDYFKQADSEKAFEFGERQLAQLERQQDLLRKHEAVIITTVATKDKLHLILTTPEVQLARESAITESGLNDLIKRFRNALKHPGSNPVPQAQELYDHLVKPLEKDLQQTQAKTLMWSLDGALRYIPLATLHDGQQFLIEKYGLSLYTAAAQNNLHENNVNAWRAAGLGVSQAHPGFEALPAVPNELRNIIRQNDNDQIGVLPGEIYLDQAFNRESFKSVIRAGYPVLHIASHFKLQPSNGGLSTLLLGDGDLLSLDEFRRQPAFRLQGVDLLTLSACDTAVGDKGTGGEVESFAVMAQHRGANSVLASLWRVEDESTGLLMKRLYRLRSENTQLSKAEALRQAQVAMLNGDLQAGESGHDFRHPYFWAPFVMMGNWL